jgi:tetratricopeptide (TPR) repeat protein
MKAIITLLLFATPLLTEGVHAAQAAIPITRAPEIRPGIPVSDGELTTEVMVYVKRGDAFRARLRFVDAAREYRSAVEIARRQGHLPSRTQWLLANAYYNQGDLVRAAAALDQLAGEAARFGDLAVEALAIFNAAWLNGQAGNSTAAASRVTQLRRLLDSPYMPVAIHRHLTARLAAPADVAVEP